VRRDVATAAGGFVTESRFLGCEDYDFWLSVARDWPLAATDAIVARYRRHATNMSGDAGLISRSQILVLERQRGRARPGTELLFDRSIARVRFERGDELYMEGRSAEARAEWHASTRLVPRPLRETVPRLAKSRIPSPWRAWLRARLRRRAG
jgi:hypothetical protein